MSNKITLNNGEQLVAKLIAEERFKISRLGGVYNGRIGPQNDEETDLEGFAAEMAFCKFANIYPDFLLKTSRGGHDCVINSKTIDVKTTKFENGKLLVKLKKELTDSNVYVLMVGKFPTYEFRGWAWAKNVMVPSKIINLGHGSTYAMEQNELEKDLFWVNFE